MLSIAIDYFSNVVNQLLELCSFKPAEDLAPEFYHYSILDLPNYSGCYVIYKMIVVAGISSSTTAGSVSVS